MDTNDNDSPHVTNWLPDETLFSLCSREHYPSGALLSRTTTQRIFGHPRKGAQHDIPANLDHFMTSTGHAFGSCTHEICHAHTLMRMYLPWRSPQEAARAIRIASGNGQGTVKNLFGLLSSKFGANHPLKRCRQCTESDRDRYATSYWHLSHQYPGVWWCPLHRSNLISCTSRLAGRGRPLWTLPDECEPVARPAMPPHHSPDCLSFMQLVQDAAQLPCGFHFDRSRLHHAYLSALQAHDLIKGERSVNLQQTASQFLGFVQPLRTLPEFQWYPVTTAQCVGHLSTIIYAHRMSGHPLRQLAFISWLFGDWASFWQSYSSSLTPLRCIATIASRGDIQKPTAMNTAIALLENGQSARQTAKKVGADVKTVQCWAADAGLKPPIRDNAIRRSIVERLLRGNSKQTIAQSYGISIQCVTQILRTEVGLSEKWHEAVWHCRQLQAQKTWLRAKAEHPTWSGTKLRSSNSAAFAWLYRNDLQWLNAHRASPVARSDTHQARVDWHARDQALVQQIQNALDESSGVGRTRITPQMLFRAVPSLSRFISKVAHLPATKALLESKLVRRSRPPP